MHACFLVSEGPHSSSGQVLCLNPAPGVLADRQSPFAVASDSPRGRYSQLSVLNSIAKSFPIYPGSQQFCITWQLPSDHLQVRTPLPGPPGPTWHRPPSYTAHRRTESAPPGCTAACALCQRGFPCPYSSARSRLPVPRSAHTRRKVGTPAPRPSVLSLPS